MKKTIKIFFMGLFFFIALVFCNKSKAAQYIWPIGGNNVNETYKEYDFYGSGKAAPIKNGKYGREYIVNNNKWPDEKSYYASSESHYGVDITGNYGQKYQVVSVVDGKVLATSGDRAYSPSVNYQDRNQRRTSGGLNDGGGYGNYVIIQEKSTGRCFLYAHLKGGSIKVSKGNEVKVGQEIATMGSSGDSGHMHLHFEIRKSKSCMISETIYGKHYLVTTNSNTNLDPEEYIGSTPNVHTPYQDAKKVNLNYSNVKKYIRYLYRTVLNREASENEVKYWTDVYFKDKSIYAVTSGIFMSKEAESKLGTLNNLDFVKKTYEIILYRGNQYTEQEMSGHVDKLNRGIWNRYDYLAMLCNCDEFANKKINAIIRDEQLRYIEGLASKEKLNKLGDLNADGIISSSDASICLNICVNLGVSDYNNASYAYAIKYADIDNDGYVTSMDACIILQYYASVSVGSINPNEQTLAQFAGRAEI